MFPEARNKEWEGWMKTTALRRDWVDKVDDDQKGSRRKQCVQEWGEGNKKLARRRKKTEMKKKEDGRAFILRHEMNTHSKKMGRRMCQGRKFHGKVREIKWTPLSFSWQQMRDGMRFRRQMMLSLQKQWVKEERVCFFIFPSPSIQGKKKNGL